MSDPKIKSESRHIKKITLIFMSLCFLLLVGNLICYSNCEATKGLEAVLVFILFLIPFLLQLRGWIALDRKLHSMEKEILTIFRRFEQFYNFYRWWMVCCLAAYTLMWTLYIMNISMLRDKIPQGTLSVIALSSVVVLLYPVTRMTRALIGKTNRSKLIILGEYAVALRFWTLVFFFSLFLGITYLFGFAFAFHDMSNRDLPALYMEELYSKKSEPKKHPVECEGMFKFREGLATLEALPKVLSDEDYKNLLKENKKNNNDKVKELLDRNDNTKALEHLLGRIEEATRDKQAIRITLTGRANEKPVMGNNYQSNYELSEARVLNVKTKMMGQLGRMWRNIEWLCLPASNEHDPIVLVDSNANQGKKTGIVPYIPPSVEVKVYSISSDPNHINANNAQNEPKEIKHLNLMDYMYFTIYTITTTGYGDIRPTTDYAKFLCSLANILEVFFFVVFFNALFSSKGTEK